MPRPGWPWWSSGYRVRVGFDTGRSFLAVRLNRPRGGGSRPGSTGFKGRPHPVREKRKKNGSTSCGGVEPSNLRDSCAGCNVVFESVWVTTENLNDPEVQQIVN